MLKRAFPIFLITSLISFATYAQTDNPEMADALRKDGKIYVVVLVLATIFVGIIALLVRLDRKIKKLENNQ